MIAITWAGPPKWWERGRDGAVHYVVVHDTEGQEGKTAAESGVAYDKVRTDSVSCHVMVDTDTALREVHDEDTAYAAFPKGNALGIQVELCHAGVWNLAEPNDAATFDNGAQVVAQLCAAHGLPALHLSVAQVRAAWYGPVKPKGICGHWDVTRAYPEDGGDHTDPGPTFPWDQFIARVQRYMTEENMALKDDPDFAALIWRVEAILNNRPKVIGGPLVGEVNQLAVKLAAIEAKVDGIQPGTGLVAHTHDGGETGPAVPA